MLEKRPDQQKLLVDVHAKLKKTIEQLRQGNEKNQQLLEDAMDMVSFNLHMLQALKSAPQTANYTKKAFNSGSPLGNVCGRFDARQ